MRPGVAERLGLGPDECLARNPRLVYGRMTGWGQTGPLAQAAGHDMNYIAVTGALHGLGQDRDRPHFPCNLVGDFGGGSTYLVIGVLAALLEARASGQGQVVDAAIVDGTAHLNAMGADDARRRLGQEQRARTCWTAACRTTTSTRPPTASTCPSAPSSRSSTTSCWSASGSPARCPTGTTSAALGDLREILTETFEQKTQAEWAEIFGGQRRLLRAGPAAHRGGRAPAHEGARRVRRARGHAPAGPRHPRFSRTEATLTTGPSEPGRRHSRGARGVGCRRRRGPPRGRAPRSKNVIRVSGHAKRAPLVRSEPSSTSAPYRPR